MTHDNELIERVALALAEDGGELAMPWSEYNENFREAFRVPARTAIAAVRAYDAERRASVLAVDALAAVEFGYQPVTDLDVIEGQKEFAAALADQRSDPDDYRDLPVATTGPVRFKGGLTEGK